jgi:hypothetical protein
MLLFHKIAQTQTGTMLLVVKENRHCHLQFLLLGLLWGFIFGMGWSFVPIVNVKVKSSWNCVRTTRGGMEMSFSSRRFYPTLFLSQTSDKGKGEDGGDDEEWSNKGKDAIRKGEVQSQSGLDEQERDLFNPIFSIIAIGGFVGLYGYETMRLYMRGELYLPFLH